MKKSLMAAVLAAAAALTTSVAFANPVELSGDVNAHYRWNTADGAADTEGGKFYFHLNARQALNENVDAFARLAGQTLTGDKVGADFSTDKYGDDVLSLDRFGFDFKDRDFTYTLGRQGATIGATALLYSTEGYMGADIGAIDGVKLTGKTGVTDLQLVAGQQWNTLHNDDKVYGLHASYSPAQDWTLGATVAKYDGSQVDTEHWAVNAGYNIGKAGLVAEYSQSDADKYDTAYAFGVDYTIDAKQSAYAFYSKVEDNGDMNGNTDFDANGKGIYLGYNYKLDKDTTLKLFYKDMEVVNGADAGDNYDSFRTTVTYKF